jgi:hypothetical protein
MLIVSSLALLLSGAGHYYLFQWFSREDSSVKTLEPISNKFLSKKNIEETLATYADKEASLESLLKNRPALADPSR